MLENKRKRKEIISYKQKKQIGWRVQIQTDNKHK